LTWKLKWSFRPIWHQSYMGHWNAVDVQAARGQWVFPIRESPQLPGVALAHPSAPVHRDPGVHGRAGARRSCRSRRRTQTPRSEPWIRRSSGSGMTPPRGRGMSSRSGGGRDGSLPMCFAASEFAAGGLARSRVSVCRCARRASDPARSPPTSQRPARGGRPPRQPNLALARVRVRFYIILTGTCNRHVRP
jgi:hypothetical protein